MAGTMGHFKYTSDNGTDYIARLDVSNQGLVGGVSVAPDSLPEAPRGMDFRYIYVERPDTHKRRKLVCGIPTNGAWVGSTHTLDVTWQEGDLLPVTANIRGRVGERRRSL